MDKAIAELAKALKESIEALGISVQQLCDVIWQHEKRLQELEKPLDIAKELSYLKTYVEGIGDSEKRNAALAELAALCNVLGINNLEA